MNVEFKTIIVFSLFKLIKYGLQVLFNLFTEAEYVSLVPAAVSSRSNPGYTIFIKEFKNKV